MPKFEIQIGRDATVYFSTTIEAESLEEVQSKVSRHGFECPEDTVWFEDGTDVHDNVEVAVIENPDGSMVRYTEQDGWVELTE